MRSPRKLGRRPPRAGLALPHVSDVAPSALPTGPGEPDWSRAIAGYDMLGNDLCGCCTIAAAANARRQFGIYAGREPDVTASDVLAAYGSLSGWSPTRPGSDTGMIETDVLTAWMDSGLRFGGELDRIDGFARIRIEPAEILQAITLFGGVMIGAELPLSAEDGLIWDVMPGPSGTKGGLGGHEMWANAGSPAGLQLITWGAKVRASWAWVQAYVDDVQVVLSRDWLLRDGRSPAGIDWSVLANAMAALPRFS